MTVGALLFDADGVIQKHGWDGRGTIGELLAVTADDSVVDDFMRDVFNVERMALGGQADFVDSMSPVLDRWNLSGRLEEFLAAWTSIELVPEVFHVIKELRGAGMRCCLATNQQGHRANYMSESLGYRNLFDREYYSCKIGYVKPEADYFDHIVLDLGMEASSLLFLDDTGANVEGAKESGLKAEHYHWSQGTERLISILQMYGVEPG